MIMVFSVIFLDIFLKACLLLFPRNLYLQRYFQMFRALGFRDIKFIT